jgi:hypothetical protein
MENAGDFPEVCPHKSMPQRRLFVWIDQNPARSFITGRFNYLSHPHQFNAKANSMNGISSINSGLQFWPVFCWKISNRKFMNRKERGEA